MELSVFADRFRKGVLRSLGEAFDSVSACLARPVLTGNVT